MSARPEGLQQYDRSIHDVRKCKAVLLENLFHYSIGTLMFDKKKFQISINFTTCIPLILVDKKVGVALEVITKQLFVPTSKHFI